MCKNKSFFVMSDIHERRFWRYKTKTFFAAKKGQVYTALVLFSKCGDIKNFQTVIQFFSEKEKASLPVYYLIDMAVLYKQKDMVLFLLNMFINICQDKQFIYTMCCKTFFEKNNEMYDIFFKKYYTLQKN